MKYLLILSICLSLVSCAEQDKKEKIDITACGVANPQEKLEWLVEIIDKAKTDYNTGNYLGTIWLEKYEGKDFFVTDMALGSGGIAYWVFDCNGNLVTFENSEKFFNGLKRNIILYSNI
jgi:hypothetical protein